MGLFLVKAREKKKTAAHSQGPPTARAQETPTTREAEHQQEEEEHEERAFQTRKGVLPSRQETTKEDNRNPTRKYKASNAIATPRT